MPKQKGTEIVDILRYEKQILLMKRIIDEIMEPTEEEKKYKEKHNKDMEQYYLKKRSEGKNHYNALGHCAVKLIRYIYFVMTHPEQEFSN